MPVCRQTWNRQPMSKATDSDVKMSAYAFFWLPTNRNQSVPISL
jgi:hypothetical protein